jgi:hypothetical protein
MVIINKMGFALFSVKLKSTYAEGHAVNHHSYDKLFTENVKFAYIS